MSAPLLHRTRIVLIRPSLPENVGAVARSMAHFGLRELVLVEGVSPTHPQALAVSAGHEDVLASARQLGSLDEALAGAVLIVGTTARPRTTCKPRGVCTSGSRARSGSAAIHPRFTST